MKHLKKNRNQSAEYACDRMKCLLTTERIHCSHYKIKLLKKDIINVTKRYFKIEEEQVKIEVSQEPIVIHVKIPVTNIRKEDLC